VETYHRMQEIDVLIDLQTDLARELVDLDIRNQQAHKELANYNDMGLFLFIHPTAIQRKVQQQSVSDLTALMASNPSKFLSEITNVEQNIRRIESNIRTKKYKSEEELRNWEENLTRSKIRKQVIVTLISK